MKHLLTGRKITPKTLHDELTKAAKSAKPSDYHTLIEKNIQITEHDIAPQLGADLTITYAVHALDETNSTLHTLSQRLEVFLSLPYPDKTRALSIEALVELSKRMPAITSPMGRELTSAEMRIVTQLARSITDAIHLREHATASIADLTQTLMPSVSHLLGPQLAARLIVEATSLKRLARMSASTIQMLGARKAVLRSMSTGAKNPKHGILFNHPYIRKSKTPGKHARILADKTAIAARVDYFKGTPIGETLAEQLP